MARSIAARHSSTIGGGGVACSARRCAKTDRSFSAAVGCIDMTGCVVLNTMLISVTGPRRCGSATELVKLFDGAVYVPPEAP